MISKSYPFLAISKRYSIDYGRVLTLADAIKREDAKLIETYHHASDHEMVVLAEIAEAVDYFKGLQSGSIPFPTT